MPNGRPGIGGTHHVALKVGSADAQLKWKRRLADLGLRVTGPFDRVYFSSIYFRDPDGLILEIATLGPGWTVDEPADQLGTTVIAPPQHLVKGHRDEDAIRAKTWPEPVPAITPDMALTAGMHHITAIGSDMEATDAFYSGLLGLRRVKKTANFDDPGRPTGIGAMRTGRPGSLITYFERDATKERHARIGTGQTHHFALRRQGRGDAARVARDARARGPARLAGDGPRLLQEHLHERSRRAHRGARHHRSRVRIRRAGRDARPGAEAAAVARARSPRHRGAAAARDDAAVAAGGGGLMALHLRSPGPHHGQPIRQAGAPLGAGRAVGILLHGRGASAESILELTDGLRADGITWLAPQAAGHTWYPNRFIAPIESNEPWLTVRARGCRRRRCAGGDGVRCRRRASSSAGSRKAPAWRSSSSSAPPPATGRWPD